MKKTVTASDIRTVSFIIALICAIPGMWKGLQGFHVWFSPFLMLNSVFALKSMIWLHTAAVSVMVAVMIRKRWFCKYLCPAGWCFDKISSISPYAGRGYNKLPHVGKWLTVTSLISALFGFPLFVIIDPLSLFNGFFVNLTGKPEPMVFISLLPFPLLLLIHFLLPGIWCKKLCPLGGLQTGLWDIKSHLTGLFLKKAPVSETELPGRRYFVMAGAGLLAGLITPGIIRSSPGKVIRPPGARDSLSFNTLCSRCGNCIRACPTRIIHPLTLYDLPLAWMTPVIRFEDGYCLETCNVCSRVCPTGAIELFPPEAKKNLFIGMAEISSENCYLLNNRDCVKCREVCKYDAISYVPGTRINTGVPVAEKSKCVGCGACAVVCPADCIVIRPQGEK